MSNVNSPEFWNSIYQTAEVPWDLGAPTPVFQRLIRSGEFPPGWMIVLGAGRGHDAREFSRNGFNVIAVDFSEQAISAMLDLMDKESRHEILGQDLFQIQEFENFFDYVLEYTCYCAIDPARRDEYADQVARFLKPGGIYIALAIPLDDRGGGPPFAVNADELIRLFEARGFTLLRREFPPDSVKPRQGLEELLILRKA